MKIHVYMPKGMEELLRHHQPDGMTGSAFARQLLWEGLLRRDPVLVLTALREGHEPTDLDPNAEVTDTAVASDTRADATVYVQKARIYGRDYKRVWTHRADGVDAYGRWGDIR